MKIALYEIKQDEPIELNYSHHDQWTLEALEKCDEQDGPHILKKNRNLLVNFILRRVDELFILDGTLKSFLVLICSRCANPFQFDCQPRFSMLFCKDPVMAGVAHLSEEAVPIFRNRGVARHAHLSDEQDLDIAYLLNDFIDFKEVLQEQAQLFIPFQPLCKEACKGLCSICAADLNIGQCACSKLRSKNAFSVLKK
jgi:uncharacterized protein